MVIFVIHHDRQWSLQSLPRIKMATSNKIPEACLNGNEKFLCPRIGENIENIFCCQNQVNLLIEIDVASFLFSGCLGLLQQPIRFCIFTRARYPWKSMLSDSLAQNSERFYINLYYFNNCISYRWLLLKNTSWMVQRQTVQTNKSIKTENLRSYHFWTPDVTMIHTKTEYVLRKKLVYISYLVIERSSKGTHS